MEKRIFKNSTSTWREGDFNIKNKNRVHQGLSKKQVLEFILDVLKIRQHTNKKSKGGRKFAKLSASATMH